MSKTIFVIGANSVMARAAIKMLAGENTIITAGRKDCDVYCDITVPFVIPSGVDVILNFAAAFGEASDEEIVKTVSVNAIGVLNICIAAKAAGAAHIVTISSLSAVHQEGSPYYSIYAISKKNGDELAEYYCTRNNIPLTILRPSQVYGDDDSFALHQPFMYQVAQKAQKGEDITIFGTHDALRNYIHVDDMNELISRVIDKTIVGTYPCMYPSNVSYSQLARSAQKVFAMGGEVVFLEDRPDTSDNVFDMDLSIYEKTGFTAHISIEAGLQRIKVHQQGITK